MTDSPHDQKYRVILDTTVVTAAAFNPNGVSEKVVALMENGEIAVTMSNRIRSEYEKTLFHPSHAARLPFLTQAYLVAFLQRLDLHAERVLNPPRHIVYKRDTNDEPFINLAVEIKADFLITLDKDLLDLFSNISIAGQITGLNIVRPGIFLTEIEGRRNKKPI